MLIGKHFKSAREATGLSTFEVARRIGSHFQESLLWDFEAGDDNDIDGWSLQDFRAYCRILNVEPTDMIDIPVQNMKQYSLPELVRKRREEKGYSIAQLSEFIGYEESVLNSLEGQNTNTTVCLQALKEIALWLDIPFRLLISRIEDAP